MVLAIGLCCATGLACAQEDAGQGERMGLPAGSQMVRGTVTASSGDTLTVKSETGDVYKVAVTANTRVMKARQAIKLTEVKAGDGLGAMGVLDVPTKTLHAVFVTVIDAEQVRKAKEDLGKTYIAGQVTAMDEVKLTIKRIDGVSQTIAVDEGTSFRKGGRGNGGMMGGGEGAGADGGRRSSGPGGAGQAGAGQGQGGESITLADVKVGDSIVARGAVKAGVFTPTEFRVVERTGRRRGGAGDGTVGAAAQGPAAGAPQ